MRRHSMTLFRSFTLGLALPAFALTGMAGCASSPTTGTRTAADEKAPPPPSDAKIQEAKAKQGEQPRPQTAKEKKQAQADRGDFDALVKRWEEARAKGPIAASELKSIGGRFASIAGAKPSLAAQAHFNAGTLYDQAGDQKAAEEAYQASLQANPAYAPAINNLGEIYYRTGAVGRAREWFEKAIKADPLGSGTAPAYTNMALILYNEAKEKGDKSIYQQAIAQLRRALALDNDSMAAYQLLATIYYTTAEGDKAKLALAELVCKQAKESNDKYAPIYNTLGLIQLKKKNVTGALKEFEKAVEIDPKYVEAHLNIGAIGLSSRQYEKAEKSFNQVLALKPDHFDATIGLGVALRGQRKIDQAEASYKKAKELDPKNCSIAYNMGVLYQDYKNDPTGANQNLKDAQKFFGEYSSCSGRGMDPKKAEDARRRSKDIDDTFTAIEQQKKMEAELKAQQEEMERQQKAMEEQMKQQQQAAPPATPAPAK